MKKIPSLFKRDFTKPDSPMTQEYTEGTEWVVDGEGVPTIKFDGACCMISPAGRFLKRREIKAKKPIPADFFLEEEDETTGKLYGWMPVTEEPQDKYFREGLENTKKYFKEGLRNTKGVSKEVPPGTYELVGPKVQGGVEGYTEHVLIKHGTAKLGSVPTDWENLKHFFENNPQMEGVVWHHLDGRMVKIKGTDLGVKRVPFPQLVKEKSEPIVTVTPLKEGKPIKQKATKC